VSAEVEAADQRPVVDGASDLLDLCELSQIVAYSLNAERAQNSIASAEESTRELSARSRFDGRHLEARFRIEVEGPGARYSADVGAIYEVEKPIELTPRATAEFMSKIGLMAVYPYLREAVTGLASRLGAPIPVIGILRLNEITFEAPGGHP